MANYPQQGMQSDEQPQVLLPNTKKIFYKNIISIIAIVGLLLGLIFIGNSLISFSAIFDVFRELGLNINFSKILIVGIPAIIVIAFVLAIGNYILMKNIRYDFYKDKLIIVKYTLFVFSDTSEIPYQNILNVSYNQQGVFNSLFNTGTIVLSLTGTDKTKAELVFIDNLQEVANYIQNALQRFRSFQQMQYEHDFRVEGIMDKGFRY